MDAWPIDERVQGGLSPDESELLELREAGYTVVISLQNEPAERPDTPPKRVRELGFTRYCIPVRDFGAPTLEQVEQFLELVRVQHRDEKVYVHCHAGIGRTGTMAAALYVARGLPAREAIDRVRDLRPGALEVPEQEEIVHAFAMTRS